MIVPMFPAYYIFNSLLSLLLILHAFWTWLILKIAYNAFYAGLVIILSDYEHYVSINSLYFLYIFVYVVSFRWKAIFVAIVAKKYPKSSMEQLQTMLTTPVSQLQGKNKTSVSNLSSPKRSKKVLHRLRVDVVAFGI
jgi:hypothetical protein